MAYEREHLEYLQRAQGLARLQWDGPMSETPVSLRRLWRIHGVGVVDKKFRHERNSKAPIHMPTLDLLTGLFGIRMPLVFMVRSEADHLSLSIGTWLPSGRIGSDVQAGKILSDRQQILRAALQSTFRSIDLRATDSATPQPAAAGIAIGIPSIKPPDPSDGSLPFDRLARGLSGASWGCLILAEPVLDAEINELRHKAMEEQKALQFYLKTLNYPNPIGQYYGQLLETTIADHTFGLAVGAWRTNVYLFGDELGYARLAAVWQGIYSGDSSLHMPIRVAREQRVPSLIAHWQISDALAPSGPGVFAHRYKHQTILTSDQLATYVHVPFIERNGFSVTLLPAFDTVPPVIPEDHVPVVIGKVVADRRETSAEYEVTLASLRAHTFVSGVTNSGKTNTIFGLLLQVAAAGVPFLVVEPAKAEYRALLNRPEFRDRLRVYTLGNERISPFRINPFEPVRGTSVSMHLDLLRSAFNASFGMWNPLPQVLERCLHAVYTDRGWNLASDGNVRDGANESPFAYPTLSDLLRKVDEIVPQLGYDAKVASDIRAALKTRLGSLCIGGKGRMLDVRTSLAPEEMYGGPIVLELEEMGDDDDKAFVMALVLIRGWEYLRSIGQTNTLRHLLVVEEAHRLLSNVANRGAEEGNPRAKAVESFTNLLSEIRAYGQGVVIVDQVPVRLAPDVIKNTNLKIAHRVVAADDRTALAGAMAMNEQQALSIATLDTGYAIAYSKGDDAPILVKVPPVRDGVGVLPADAAVQDAMRPYTRLLPGSHWACQASLQTQRECERARAAAELPEIQQQLLRFALSSIGGAEEDIVLRWRTFESQLQARREPGMDFAAFLRCMAARAAEVCADEWGQGALWPFAAVMEFTDRLREVMLDAHEGHTKGVAAFRDCVRRVTRRAFDPYARCSEICDAEPLCLYRHATATFVRDPGWRDGWLEADAADRTSGNGRARTWQHVSDLSLRIVDALDGGAAQTRAALCYAQQMLAASAAMLVESRDVALSRIAIAAVESEVSNG